MQNDGNDPPPATIVPGTQLAAGDFRLFNDFGNSKGIYQVGITPDPCKTGVIPNWLEAGQSSQYNGASGTSPSNEIYQIAEGRVGLVGQSVNLFLTNHSTPWIWTAIEFDSSGKPTYSNYAMFPTYSVYTNGSLTATYPQSAVSTFSNQDSSYELTPSEIP